MSAAVKKHLSFSPELYKVCPLAKKGWNYISALRMSRSIFIFTLPQKLSTNFNHFVTCFWLGKKKSNNIQGLHLLPLPGFSVRFHEWTPIWTFFATRDVFCPTARTQFLMRTIIVFYFGIIHTIIIYSSSHSTCLTHTLPNAQKEMGVMLGLNYIYYVEIVERYTISFSQGDSGMYR